MECEKPIWIEKETHPMKGQEVPCGKCLQCLEKIRAIWTFRILNELEVAESARFITLTYDDANLPMIWEGYDKEGDPINKGIITMKELVKQEKYNVEDIISLTPTLNKEDHKKLIKAIRSQITEDYKESEEKVRWMKESPKTGKYSPKLRYFLAGEYGKKSTKRPHYHVIMYNLPNGYYKYDPIHEEEFSNMIEEIWDKGNVHIGQVTRESAHYVAKYTIKNLLDKWDEERLEQKPYAVMSRMGGIGKNYTENEEIKNNLLDREIDYTHLKGGYIQPIGRYYKDRIFEEKVYGHTIKYKDEEGKEHEKKLEIRGRNKALARAKQKHREENKRIEETKLLTEIEKEYGDIEQAEKNIEEARKEQYKILKMKSKIEIKKRKL